MRVAHCAFVASKILLLLLIGCDRAASNDVLMLGNSYTHQNNGIDQALQALFDDAPNVSGTAQRLTQAGWTLAQHAVAWQGTILDTGSFDYVVLQDQSRVPSYALSSSAFMESQDGAIVLDDRAENMGAESILFLTWGRRGSGYLSMQSDLVRGYTAFAQAITDGARKPYIAPVGLAFKKIYDDIAAEGKNPWDNGTLYYYLYNSDNSHCNRLGTYLAACVFFSTITGESTVGRADSVELDADTRKKLQEAADYAVFEDDTFTKLGYNYPWQEATTPPPAQPETPDENEGGPATPDPDDNEGGPDPPLQIDNDGGPDPSDQPATPDPDDNEGGPDSGAQGMPYSLLLVVSSIIGVVIMIHA